MKKMFLVLLGLLVMVLFVVGCTPSSVELTDEEGNLVGEALRIGRSYRVNKDVREIINKNAVPESQPALTTGSSCEYIIKILEGEKSVLPQGNITLLYVDSTYTKVVVDTISSMGMTSNKLKEGDAENLGYFRVNPIEILYQDFAGVYQATFCINPSLSCSYVINLMEGESYLLESGLRMSIGYIDDEYVRVIVGTSPPSDKLKEGDAGIVGGLVVTPLDILYQNLVGGVHRATFCIN